MLESRHKNKKELRVLQDVHKTSELFSRITRYLILI